jgi:hypothetical protein
VADDEVARLTEEIALSDLRLTFLRDQRDAALAEMKASGDKMDHALVEFLESNPTGVQMREVVQLWMDWVLDGIRRGNCTAEEATELLAGLADTRRTCDVIIADGH